METEPQSVLNPFQDIDTRAVFLTFVLVAARIRAFMTISPFFGQRAMLGLVRLGFIVSIAVIVVPGSYEALSDNDELLYLFFILLSKEVLLGLLISTFVWLPIRSLELAGVVMDSQRGGMLAEEFDPMVNAQTTPTANLLSKIFTGYFFATGGMLVAINLLFQSFSIWPPAETFPLISVSALSMFIDIAGGIFLYALYLAIPVMGFLFLADIAIALVARTAPSLNALVFAMPVKSMLLILVLSFYIDLSFPRILNTFKQGLISVEQVLIASEELSRPQGVINER